MADHDDDFGSSTPPPTPARAGHLDDLNFGDETGGPAPLLAGETPAIPEAHAARFKHPHPAPRVDDGGPRYPAFPMFLGAAMVLCLVVVWIMNAKSVTSSEPGTTAAPAAPDPAEDVKALRAEVEGLKADWKAAQGRIEALSRPDLGPINSKIDDLARTSETLAALPRKVEALDKHLAALDRSLAAQRDDLDALKSEVRKVGEPARARPEATAVAPAPEDAGKPEDVNVADSSMEAGVNLFMAGKYKEASDVFKKLTGTNPDDARVWYYAALSRGSATKEWTGETKRLVEKGAEREKAGSPESSEIDAAFASMSPAFKPWLDNYRKSARSR